MNTPPRKPPRPVPPRTSHARPDGSATPLPPDSAPLPPSFPPQGSTAGPRRQSIRPTPPAAEQAEVPPTRVLPQGQQPSTRAPLPSTGMGAVNRTQLLQQGTPARDYPPRQPPAPPAGAPPAGAPPGPGRYPGPGRRPRRRRSGLRAFIVVLVLLLAWPVGLAIWANGKIAHVDALTDRPAEDYTTYLLAGSDSRGDGYFANDSTEGERADSLMLLTVPRRGTSSLVSIPRDTYVEIPGHRANKINASYALGGPQLLVETVEGFTGMKVDHYAEIGMGGVAAVVDAVGTINLCLDLEVDDPKSKLTWTPGCHDVDGATALAFGRMRYQDPRGDIGRADRQRQIIQAVTKEVARPSSLNPLRQLRLVDAGVGAIAVDEDSNILTLGRLALAFRTATGDDGVRGTPPISSTNYQPGGVGSAVLVTDEDARWFFGKVADGSISSADVD